MKYAYASYVCKFLFIGIFNFSISAETEDPVEENDHVSPQLIDDEELPQSMATMGDSISAGMLAMYSREQAQNIFVDFRVILRLVGLLLRSDTRSMETPKLSWASGLDSKYRTVSHAHRLSYMLGKKINAYNAAVSGNESKDLLNQLADIVKWSKKNNHNNFPDYVTILIGANDICADDPDSMVTPDVYENNLREVVGQILKKNPQTKVFLSSLPDIENLRSIAKDSMLMGRKPFPRCQDLWRKVNPCPTLTTLDDPQVRGRVKLRVEEFNSVLARIASENQLLGYQVRNGHGVFDSKFDMNLLSVDCFHPNRDGQSFISEKTWEGTWWNKLWEDRYAKSFSAYLSRR